MSKKDKNTQLIQQHTHVSVTETKRLLSQNVPGPVQVGGEGGYHW